MLSFSLCLGHSLSLVRSDCSGLTSCVFGDCFFPPPPSCRVLRERQHIAVRVLEPRHFVSAGEGAYALLVLSHVGVMFEGHSLCSKLSHCRSDLVHFPAEDCILHRRVAGHLADAQQCAIKIEDQRKAVVAEKGEAECIAVEAYRGLRSLREQEGDDAVECHGVPRVSVGPRLWSASAGWRHATRIGLRGEA